MNNYHLMNNGIELNSYEKVKADYLQVFNADFPSFEDSRTEVLEKVVRSEAELRLQYDYCLTDEERETFLEDIQKGNVFAPCFCEKDGKEVAAVLEIRKRAELCFSGHPHDRRFQETDSTQGNIVGFYKAYYTTVTGFKRYTEAVAVSYDGNRIDVVVGTLKQKDKDNFNTLTQKPCRVSRLPDNSIYIETL